jgi:putative membrane protein
LRIKFKEGEKLENIFMKITGVLDDGHMGDGDHMMGGWSGWWFGMWFWWLAVWLIMLFIGFLVYKDAENRGKNGLLWFVLVIIPWFGIIALIMYLIIRDDHIEEQTSQKSSDLILDERYAKGEISRMEYLRMKDDLNRTHG